MSRKKKEISNEASAESKDERFRRLANIRAKKVIHELGRLVNMTSQPNYDILDKDAETLRGAIQTAYDSFNQLYTRIANGETIKPSRKEVSDIF